MPLAIVLIVLATLYRLLPTMDLSLSNFTPVMAIAFCGAVYFRNRWMWLIPFVALSVSDVYINHFYAKEYGYTWPLSGLIARTACFGAALLLGAYVARRKSWLSLLNGGHDRWAAEGRATTVEYAFHRAAAFTPRPRPDRAVSLEQVRDWRKNKLAGIIVDARSIPEYDGTMRRGKRAVQKPSVRCN